MIRGQSSIPCIWGKEESWSRRELSNKLVLLWGWVSGVQEGQGDKNPDITFSEQRRPVQGDSKSIELPHHQCHTAPCFPMEGEGPRRGPGRP